MTVFALKKTPIASPYRRALDQANDAMCFSLFLYEGFDTLAESVFAANSAKLAREAFPDRGYAKLVNLSESKLKSLGAISLKASLQYNLMTAIEHSLYYYEDATKLLSTHGIEKVQNKDDGHEEVLAKTIQKAKPGKAFNELFHTVTYFRHYRNLVAHPNYAGNAQQHGTGFQTQHAHQLNTFWAGRKRSFDGFDFKTFQSLESNAPSFLTAVDIVRICLHELDGAVADSLPFGSVIRAERLQLLKRDPKLSGSMHLQARKLAGILKRDYGLSIEVTQVITMLD
jgi:hypothetical protein